MNDELDVDEEAYDMLFSPVTPWPCLSLDFVLGRPGGGHPSIGEAKKEGHDKDKRPNNHGRHNQGGCSPVTYPLQITCVAGSQAAKGSQNEIYLLRWDNLNRLKGGGHDSDEDDSDEEDSDEEDSDEEDNDGKGDSGNNNGNCDNGGDACNENGANARGNHRKGKRNPNGVHTQRGARKKEHVVCKAIKHPYGGLNRVKTCKKINSLIATWCEDSNVYIYELSDELRHLDDRPYSEDVVKKPLHVFDGHTTEGFSLDWNPVHAAKLLSGDNDGNLFLWLPDNSDKWTYERLQIEVGTDHSDEKNGGKGEEAKGKEAKAKGGQAKGGQAKGGQAKGGQAKGRSRHSIEDVQWIKGGNGFGHVFAMCSSDKSVTIVDTRDLKKGQNNTDGRSSTHIQIADAHASDVNVISWNENVPFLIASGGDDSVVKIWDTRNTSTSVAELKFHRRPISAVSWNPSDTYVVLAASLDNSISIWDLSVESESLEFGLTKHPDQLLFEHRNQKFITDAKFHPLHPGVVVSTSSDNFNIFKPCNV
ncbi:hypothetical protein C922_02564 [Plasmodium inui San Antonio 1]|uniref:Histone-binding protein RBBP4-like N-terminal domain-containing protein n=1 Tax=Plasmodium inui San Antonio 1 TaxID=1237626 RepID=W7A5F7_9APIC|nr:hypothetical protein C922_02564 [Plasmodium inui San Antonio 1]EUD66980.1 hypothetical protein C922_02564 [Plasmodium inui San Antonio 1]